MTDPGVEAPIGPVLGRQRTSRERFRIAAAGVVAVIVFGAGIGLAGHGLTNANTASPSAAAAATTTSTPGPAATADGTRVPPTQNVGLGCAPVRLGSPPELRLSSDAGNLASISGILASPAPAASSQPSGPWPIPGLDDAARLVNSEGILLAADLDACVRYVIAEYRPADPTLTGPYPIAFHALNVSPPRSIVPLGPLPTGDWVVRIVAHFSTGVAGQENANVAERFFRVVSGQGQGPLPTPATPPAVPCTVVAAGAPPADLVLLGSQEGPIVGIPPGTGPPVVANADPGRFVEIRDAHDACARSWAIRAMNVDTGQTIDIDTQDNPTSDPFQFAQNRWRLLSLPTGLLQITATMGYSADLSVTRRWSLIVRAPDFPVLTARAPDGSSAQTVAGCGASWAFHAGTGIVDACSTVQDVAGLENLAVPFGTSMRLDAGDWTIASWSGLCGRVDPAGGGSLDSFEVVDGCDLGGSLVPGKAAFIPRPGAPIVRLSVVLERAGATVTGDVFVSLVVGRG